MSSWSGRASSITSPEGHDDILPPSQHLGSRILFLIRPRTCTSIFRTTPSLNEVVVEGDVDAGGTGLRGNNAENSGVLRMKSAMERCGRGDRIRRRERSKHRKTRSKIGIRPQEAHSKARRRIGGKGKKCQAKSGNHIDGGSYSR